MSPVVSYVPYPLQQKKIAARMAAVLVLLGVALCDVELHAGFIVEGRVLDGAASTESIRPQQQPTGFEVPLADQEVELLATGAAVGPWTVQTDAAGAFRVDTGIDRLPPETLLVVRARIDGLVRYSPSRPAKAGTQPFFVYPLSSNPARVQSMLKVVHDITSRTDAETEKTQKLLRVRIRVQFLNRSGELYVGTSRAGRSREVFRVPVPAGAEVLRNQGPIAGTYWEWSKDRKHLVVRQPVGGLADVMTAINRGEDLPSWDIEYTLPASEYFTARYEFDVRPSNRESGDPFPGFLVYVPKDVVQLTGQDFGKGPEVGRDPLSGEETHLDVYGPKKPLEAGQSMLVPLELDSQSIGRIDREALWWHGGTLCVALGALFLGLLFGRKRPPAEAVLDNLSSEQVLDRIAELDDRFERKEISEAEYLRYRAPLVEIAAEELRAGEGGSSESAAPGASDGAVTGSRTEGRRELPAEVESLIEQVREIDARSEKSPEAIGQRAGLLESLYQALQAAARESVDADSGSTR